ncbi:MAG: class I SAM-dependent methyltransferase [Devosia sp.]
MQISDIIANDLRQDGDRVWRLVSHESFNYSDGVASERYLRHVFSTASDLTSQSTELESYIKDWPSEYHLTRKRAQLLAPLTFDRSLRVLEVGCGCGAITRHLGENFDQVVSVEGSIERARLARLRAKDLDSVSVVCSPFQSIQFKQKFDIIFCIGVFEYSGAFILGDDPYRRVLDYFSDILAPGGILVVAIENQFGLKYFNGAREDHLGTYFEGIEGYHRHPGRARTFGKTELEDLLRPQFPHVRFFYPYPDYKIPECVLSDDFLASGFAGELVSQIRSRDYSGPMKTRWDETLVNLDLARNRQLEFFANSFLVVAGKGELPPNMFNQLGVLYSNRVTKAYSTQTRIVRGSDGTLAAEKVPLATASTGAAATLRPTISAWSDGVSLSTLLRQRAQASRSVAELFEPCRSWIALLESESFAKGDRMMLDGGHVDSVWGNTYPQGASCELIDREWVWNGDLPRNVVVIRAIYDFLSSTETLELKALNNLPRSGKTAIRSIATSIGTDLFDADFEDFMEVEAKLVNLTAGLSLDSTKNKIKWFLLDRPSRGLARRVHPWISSFTSRVETKLQNLRYR